MHNITLISGDGIGPEIVEAVKEVLQAAGVDISWDEHNAGAETFDKTGELIPQALIDSVEKNRVALKGPIATPIGKGFKSVNVQLRQIFDLYSNVRPCKTTQGVKSRYDNVDLVIFRENTEGMYSGLEVYDERRRMADGFNRISYDASYRLIESAFQYAVANGRKKVTLVHKANILKKAGQIFLEAGADVAKKYPQIEKDDKIIDNMCMQLVVQPELYDVIAATNLFGDILSDLCAGLVGGLGVVAGANRGTDIAIYEAVHGTAPDIAGKGIANPTALLRSALMMLHDIGEQDAARNIELALEKVLADPSQCTGDLGGKASTKQFAQNIIGKMESVR